MAGTDITGLNNRLSRRNQDILKAIRSGVSDKRRALTSLRVNFNKSRTELAETKRSLNRMNIEELNVKIADIADKLKQATGLLEQLQELNDADDAVGILQRTVKIMSDEYKYASNRLKGGILDYNTVNRGIVDLSNRIEPRSKTPGPVMVPTANIAGPGIPLYNRDTSKSPRQIREPKVSINRVGNFVVTRLATPAVPLSRSIPQRVPNFRMSQTAIRNESEHKEWQKSFFKQFEDSRDKKFQEVIKALKGLKFSNLPGPNNGFDFDMPEVPDKPEGKDNKKPGSGGGDGKNRTTDRKSQGLRAGFAVGNNQRALAEASEMFTDEQGNPIKDEYGNNPGLYVLKKGKELLESKVVEEGFQGLRNRARGLFGLAPDTPETATTVSPEASKPAATIDNGKIQPHAVGAPLVNNTSMDVRESEVLLDEEWLKRLLQNLLGMNGSQFNGSQNQGGGDAGSGNGGKPAALAPNSTGAQPSSGQDGGGTPGQGDDKGTKPAAPDSDKGDKPAPSVNTPDSDNSPKQETPNPVVKPDAPKADAPSSASGGTQQGDATSANPNASSGHNDQPKATRPDLKPPVSTPSATPSPSSGDNSTPSPAPSATPSPVPPATTPMPSGDANKTTGETAKDADAPEFEMKMDEIEVSPDKPNVDKVSANQPTNSNMAGMASLASYSPENKAKQAGVIDDDDDTPVAPVIQTDKQKAEFDYTADLTRKKEEAWQQYQRDAAPRDGEGLSDYMKRRDTMGLDNGGRKETDVQPGGYNAIDKKQQLDESFEQYQKSDTWQGKYGSRIDSGQLVEDAKNRTGNRTPDEFTPDAPLSLDEIKQFRGPSLTPNADTAGDSRVPFRPRMPKPVDDAPIERSIPDTSSSMGNTGSTTDSTATGNTNNSKTETPKSIIKTEGLGMVQIDGEYLT